MRYHEIITEKPNLKLRQGQLTNLPDSPFLVAMHPMDFIRLACTGDDCVQTILDRSKDRIKPDDEYEADWEGAIPGRFTIPTMKVEYPSGRVLTHEGRHRSASVYLSGGKAVPVLIRLQAETSATLTYTREDWETGVETEHSEEFNSYADAANRKDELRNGVRMGGDEASYHDLKIEERGGNGLRGHPGRSEGWSKAPWRVEDFPDQLIGEFDPSVVIPKSRLKIGLNRKGNVERPGKLQEAPVIAYHGTPHSFDAFNLDAIGTGEGMQAFGWGLYFAGDADIATHYQKRLSNGAPGHFYSVQLPDDSLFLDWEKPLTSQEDVWDRVIDAVSRFMGDPMGEELAGMFDAGNMLGQHVYEFIAKTYELGYVPDGVFSTPSGKAAKMASETLSDAGIAGIKYLDGQSRDEGHGHHNYVVFDAKSVKITGRK